MAKFDIDDFNKEILAMMEKNGTDWSKTWFDIAGEMMMNANSGHVYQGMNIWILMLASMTKGYTSSKWATFATWKRMGYSVKKGEHGTTIFFWNYFEKEDGKTGAYMKSFVEFNSDQVWTVEDHQPYVDPDADKPKPYMTVGSDLVEQIIDKLGITAVYGGNRAFHYHGEIHIPHLEQFNKDVVKFDATRLHEIGHWVRHKIDDFETAPKGSVAYAEEELSVELSAAALGKILGIEQTPLVEHAQYLNSWMEGLRTDKQYFLKASKKAWQIIKYVCSGAGIEVDFGEKEPLQVGETVVE